MKKLIIISLLSLTVNILSGQTINIPADYPTIQAGINAASEWDTILIDIGTYKENIIISEKRLIIGSKFLITGDTSYISKTIIDGNQNGTVVTFGPEEAGDTHFSGFTIKNGSGNAGGNAGGIAIIGTTPPTLSYLVITSNTANQGGGILCTNSSGLNLSNSTIINNTALQKGGGIQSSNSNLKIKNCDFVDNKVTGQAGGAISFEVSANDAHTRHIDISSSKFIRNECVNGSTGGIYAQQNGDMNEIVINITDCAFEGNKSKGNNALLIRGDYVRFNILNCIFAENEAEQYCGGAAFIGNCNGRVVNCLFKSNHAATGGEYWNSGGASVWSGAKVDFLNCAFVENTASYGAGLSVGAGASANLVNCIFWGNENDQIAIVDFNENGGNVFAGHSNIQYGQDSILMEPNSELNWGDNNLDLDPLFSGKGDHPYSLDYLSPCIDAGTPDTFGLSLPKYDLTGNLRVRDGDSNEVALIDMGPYEYWSNPLGRENPVSNYNKWFVNCYPNPFSTSTSIEYNLNQASEVTIHIYNHLGELLDQIHQHQQKGKQLLVWNAEYLPSGVYLIKLQTGKDITAKKIVKK